MRKVMVTGFIAADVQKQISSTGTEYFNVRIANTEPTDKKDANGNSPTYWYRATSFNPQLFRMIPSLKKGSHVMVIGNYNDNIYQNKNGNCDISRDIIIDSINFVGGGKSNQGENKSVEETTTTVAKEMPKVTNSAATQKSAPLKATKEVLSDDSDEDDELPF